MRLRRETGDFSIVFSDNIHACQIQKGLGPKDLIGAVVEIETVYGSAFTVLSAIGFRGENETPYIRLLVEGTSPFYYNPETGVVTGGSEANNGGNLG